MAKPTQEKAVLRQASVRGETLESLFPCIKTGAPASAILIRVNRGCNRVGTLHFSWGFCVFVCFVFWFGLVFNEFHDFTEILQQGRDKKFLLLLESNGKYLPSH